MNYITEKKMIPLATIVIHIVDGSEHPLLVIATDREEDIPKSKEPLIFLAMYLIITENGMVAPLVFKILETGFYGDIILNPYSDQDRKIIETIRDKKEIDIAFININNPEPKPTRTIRIKADIAKNILETFDKLKNKIPLTNFEKAKQEYMAKYPLEMQIPV